MLDRSSLTGIIACCHRRGGNNVDAIQPNALTILSFSRRMAHQTELINPLISLRAKALYAYAYMEIRRKNINSDSCHVAVKPLLKVTQPIISPLRCTSKGRRTKNQSIFRVAAPCSPFFIRIVVCDYTQKFLMIS